VGSMRNTTGECEVIACCFKLFQTLSWCSLLPFHKANSAYIGQFALHACDEYACYRAAVHAPYLHSTRTRTHALKVC
jgi:hypothetical protein